MIYLMRVIFVLLLATLLASCLPSFKENLFYIGEIELEINGEIVKHSRAWKCEQKTVFRTESKDFFETRVRQKPTPIEHFVVKRFGADNIVLFENWMGCGAERRSNQDWTVVNVFDSIEKPSYREQLYLKVGTPITIHNPFKNGFKTRLIKESVTEIDRRRYESIVTKPSDDGADLLYQLRLKTAYSLTVDVFTWNDTDKTGLRLGVPLNNTIWEIDKLQAPQSKKASKHIFEDAVINSSFILLSPGYRGAGGKLSPPLGARVQYAGKVIELDERGFAEIQRPEPSIRLARFYPRIETNNWTTICLVNPPPQCPKVAASTTSR